MKGSILSGMLILGSILNGMSQSLFPTNDISDQREELYAFTNGTIVVDYKSTLENATLLIKGDEIINVGQGISIPAGSIVIDLKGNYIYPSFIDLYTQYGLTKEKKDANDNMFTQSEQYTSLTKGAYNGNEAIKSEFNAAEHFSIDSKKAKELREKGFGSVLLFRDDGLARGTSSFVTLGTKSDNDVMINDHASANYSFTKGSSKQLYPISQMGYISVLEQTYINADWYASQTPPPFIDLSLEAWNASKDLPQIFDTNGWLEILRADRLGDEFGIQYIIKGGGDEYQRINEVKETGASLIIPINFPDAYDVQDPLDANEVSLEEMKHWELAPSNPSVLAKNNILFSFTAAGLKSIDDYLPNIRKAIKEGLSEGDALKALTSTPASMINESDRIGSISKGKIANFIITSKPLFDEKSQILENWVQGERFILKELSFPDFAGMYQLKMGDSSYSMKVEGEAGSQKAQLIINDSTNIDLNAKFELSLIEMSFSPEEESGSIRLSGWKMENGWMGKGQLIDGTWIEWTALFESELKKEEEKPKETSEVEKPNELGPVIYPFAAHGNIEIPQAENILIKNATLWTNEESGIVENYDLLLIDGKISKIGKDLNAEGARVINAKGKHVTSGIIDEHSHIAASAINDLAINSSMVEIGKVIDPSDNNIYTALSGGVTAVQILHGSANPIGGQSAIIKLRWGSDPEGMKIKDADHFIKFALGENVKRSYNPNSTRFPQSRMGVEQVYMDAFSNALDYESAWENYNSLSKKEKENSIAPRRDLAMETMVEILNEECFISCHSYVQSEINMLMKVADQFDFRVNTFTHILEGYKVADKMKAHGVGASTFSDWWAYKWEVRYAIPYNAAIMHDIGITVAINSDDAEMGRRLNQEAAKTIKYGGLSEEEAWKTVTLNPAILLHLDDHMGSLKEGKDADVVIWSDNPLSIYAKVETTIIDGTIFYDTQKDEKMNEWILKERARLIQKMNAAKSENGKSQKSKGSRNRSFHCDDITLDLSTLND